MSKELATNLDAELIEYAGKVLAAIRGVEHSDRDSLYSVIKVEFGFEGEEIPEFVLEESVFGELRGAVYVERDE